MRRQANENYRNIQTVECQYKLNNIFNIFASVDRAMRLWTIARAARVHKKRLIL